jgi:flagellar protein FlaG
MVILGMVDPCRETRRTETMDIGSVRPVVTGVTAPVPRAPAASEQTVRTEMPVRAVVSEAAKSDRQARTDDAGVDSEPDAEKSRAAARRKQVPAEREVDREIELDTETKALVFRKIDVQSGDVVQQVPEEAMLRMRALIHAWGEGGAAPTGRSAAYDVTA